MTVKEVSEISKVSIRTLHYYDKIGLLKPSHVTVAGYRQYDDIALKRLQQILLFRELEFPLKEIKKILDNNQFDQKKALDQQIELLTLKQEHLKDLIDFARELQKRGDQNMNFEVFDTKKIDEYTKKAKEQWSDTKAYQEFEQKHGNRSTGEEKEVSYAMMQIFAEFKDLMDKDIADAKVQMQVKKLQDFITANYYNCTNEILQGLGKMYEVEGEFQTNIDKASKKGCAKFVALAIEVYCN